MQNLINTPLWYVTKPTRLSELVDICFKANLSDLARQFKGGLDPEEIVAVFADEAEAMQTAGELLASR